MNGRVRLAVIAALAACTCAQTAARKKPAVAHPSQLHPSGIQPERAAQIQLALVTAGYLDHASGHWDQASAAAMKKFQLDHHWQTRFVPDARALIALGLDPGHPAPAPTPAPSGGF